ncbi:MAG: hypothetical protein A2Y34_03905 [Spirochaetes bacterium GWC1_27_15]|nr:MAG: hypothetical protein A2Y34_03905 [Spirochaetes bacterium GWC1_27_15]
MKKLEFGYKCKDIVTGFEGILKSRGMFITGCDRVELVKDSEEKWFDAPVVKILDDGVYNDLLEAGCNKFDDLNESLYDYGVLARDKITGYEGKIIAKSISITGDISYGLSPKFAKESKNNDATWFDESRLEVVDDKKDEIKTNERRTGGAVPNLRCR